MFKKGITWDRVFLFVILALAAFLSLYGSWNQGYSNAYYAAAVKSMLTSFHSFFFASFDGGGFVSVDKPPLGLWIETLSALIFGFQGWSLILPEALAAVISTALVYHLVRRSFGVRAGLIAGLAFALTPIMVAVSRTNNFDTMVVMFVLLAAWAVMIAAERGSLKWLLLSAGLVGAGFNIKMLQAFLVIPAVYLLYSLAPGLNIKKKIGHMIIATVVLLIVSLSWAVIVDTTPAGQRPYVGSSQTNSVIELALGYNGIQRVTGMQFGHINGSPSGGPGEFMSAYSSPGTPDGAAGDASFPGGDIPEGLSMPGGGGMPGGMGGIGNEGGPAGWFRLFDQQLAGQISWLLPLAIIGFFAALLTLRKGKDEESGYKIRQVLFWGMWLLPMIGYFSIAGFFHRYYLVMMAPGIAALCAIGLAEMWKAYQGRGWPSLLLPMSLLATALIQAYFIFSYPEWRTWLLLIICPVSFTATFILLFAKFDKAGLFKGVIRPLVGCMCAVLLIAPALWSLTPLVYHTEATIPYAGPDLDTGRIRMSLNLSMPGGGMGMPSMGSFNGISSSDNLTRYLLDHWNNETYLVAVPSAMVGSSLILETGKPVMAIGGFTGSDPILTTDRLEKMVENGEVRYFLASGSPDDTSGNSTGNVLGPMGGGQAEINSWVKAHGKLVPEEEWSGDSTQDNAGFGMPGFGANRLYDLKGGD